MASSHNHPGAGCGHGPGDAGSPGLPRSRVVLPRLAFYGRTNARGINGVHLLAGQLDACLEAADERAAVTCFFYDMGAPLDELTVLAVRGAGGPPCRDGGWDDLAAAIPVPTRGFDAIVCATPGRLSPSPRVAEQRAALAARHGVPVTTAGDLPSLFPHGALPPQRCGCRPTTGHEADHAPTPGGASLFGVDGAAEAVLRAAVNLVGSGPLAPATAAPSTAP